MKYVILLSMLFSFSLKADDHSHHHHHEADEKKEAAAVVSDESIYNSGAVWTNMNGEKKLLPSLKGKVRVIAMVYTSCQYACPIITADILRIEKAIPEKLKDKVGFALFSFDPQRDTPEALKKYFNKKDLGSGRWELFTSNEQGVRELAAMLGVKYKKDKDGEFKHSNLIFVLDQEGVVKHQQVGLNQDPHETVEAITKLAQKK